MTATTYLRSGFTILGLAGLLACGGGGGSSAPAPAPAPAPTATGLAYADPAAGGYRLVKHASSAGSHLVLDLVGPATGTAMGVSIALNADAARVTWVDVPAGGTTAVLMQNGTQFSLGSGTPILKAKAAGGVLRATVAQKAPTAPASLNGTLLRVALDLKPGLGLAPGTVIPLQYSVAGCEVLDGTNTLSTIAIGVGTLTAQ